MNVAFFRHDLSSDNAASMAAVLTTPFLTSGPVGKKVEAQLADFFDVPHALLSNSWTNGALATLLALGIGPGDEVIVPAMTFIATANVVELLGATPVLVDVDPDTLLMRAGDMAGALGPRTRAVIPVHLYGRMCDIPAMRRALGERDDVAIIEDCAHCFEGERDGLKPGSHSDAAIFSFYATKNIACGEGGAIITRRGDLHEKLLQTRLHGMSAGAADRFKTGSYSHWDMARLGVKANLPDLLAALLPEQISRVHERRERRERIAGRYREAFGGLGLRFPAPVPETLDAHHLFTIALDSGNRDETLAALAAAGVGVTVNYRAIHTLSYYRDKYGFRPRDFPAANDWGERTISLPMYPSLTVGEQDHVIASVKRIVNPHLEQAVS